MNPVEQQLAVAARLAETGSFDRASQVLDGVAGEAIDLRDFWWLRAKIASDRDDEEGAVAAARAGLARFPQDEELLVLLGRALHDQGKLAEAEEALPAALAVDPEDIEALCAYARVVATAGQLDKARRLVARAAELEPAAGVILASRYYIAHLTGDDAETSRVADELARFTEGDPHALAVLGIEAVKRGDVRTSKALLGRAAAADVRVVDSVGAEVYREIHLMSHPLMWPLWPVHRYGGVAIWIGAVAGVSAINLAGYPEYAGMLALVWLAWVLYTWIAPPLVRRLLYGASR